MASSRRSPGSEHGFWVMINVSMDFISQMFFQDRFQIISLLAQPLLFSISQSISVILVACVAHRLLQQQLQVQVMRWSWRESDVCLFWSFFFCFFDQGIGSRSAAWASRVDIVWVSVCVSSVVRCCSYVWCCCIHVALYAFCMYPNYYVMVRSM